MAYRKHFVVSDRVTGVIHYCGSDVIEYKEALIKAILAPTITIPRAQAKRVEPAPLNKKGQYALF